MRYVTFKNLKPGMVLGRNLIGDNGAMLAKAGVAVSDAIIRRVSDMGLQGLYIEDPLFCDIVVEDIVPEKLRSMGIEALKKGDYNSCVNIAKSLALEVKSRSSYSIDLIDLKSYKNYEYYHSLSVCVYSICMGYAMKMRDEQIDNLAVAGILHDIGKFDVKRRVLNSKALYNEKQMDEMMKHPMYSYEELKDNPYVTSVSRNSILFHHENIDGSGYYNISGEKLGIFPKILRVVDTYDALTATRRHRAAFSPADAFRNIVGDAGKIFDYEVVKTFVSTFPMYPKGITVKLADGTMGVVTGQTEDEERPIIRTFDRDTINLLNDSVYKTIKIEDIV